MIYRPPLWLVLALSAFWLTVIGSARMAFAECPTTQGDVNGNGIVNATDANEIQRFVVGHPPVTSFEESCCDVNCDGRCNTIDARLIQRGVPICEPDSIARLSAAPVCDILGDVNGNGVVNVTDANEIQRHSVPLPPVTSFDASCCDVNCNGVCNTVDAHWIVTGKSAKVERRDIRFYQPGAPADSYVLDVECRAPITFGNHTCESNGVCTINLILPTPNTITLFAFNQYGQSEPSNTIRLR